jgi:hypothetical protein
MADAVSKNSSKDNLGQTFILHKGMEEQKPLDFASEDDECCSRPFTYDEVLQSLEKSRGAAVGPDRIRCRLLKHLPGSSGGCLLQIVGAVWEGESFPPLWSQTAVVPVPEHGKNHSDPNGCRLMALTCVCRAMGDDRWALDVVS